MGMIVGWKAIARVAGVDLRTVKRWHYERCRIPFSKTTSAQQGKVMILDTALFDWLRSLNQHATISRR